MESESVSLQVTKCWPGLDRLKYLIVFGDSFSSVGYSNTERHPSAEHPLGIDFPGITTCEKVDASTQEVTYEPNWVGHLVQLINASRPNFPLLIYDYAVSGDTIARMRLWQYKKEFLPQLGSHPDSAPWISSDTLFISWIGINDCIWNARLQASSAQPSFDDLFKTQESLYGTGARNFCFIGIPPLHKFPAGPKTARAEQACLSWNPMLRERAEQFAAAHPDATVLVCSPWDLFMRILAHPEDVTGALRATDLFVDEFHPSSTVHALIAEQLVRLLRSAS